MTSAPERAPEGGLAKNQARLKSAMRRAGWPVLDIFVNPETGRVRIIAEQRNHSTQTGLKLMIDRAAFGCQVTQSRDLTVFRVGFYTSGWEVDLSPGAGFWVRHPDLNDAIASLGARVAEDAEALGAEVALALNAAVPNGVKGAEK